MPSDSRPPSRPGPPGARAVELDRLVHEPARLAVLALLAVVDAADFPFLAAQTGLSGGNLSSHLKKLESAGYVSVAKTYAGRRPRTVLALTDRGRQALGSYRDCLRQVLESLPD